MTTIMEHFKDLPDHRKANPNKQYSAELIIFIAISAFISGCNSWVSVAEFGKEKVSWLKKFISVPEDRTPSHDTIGVFFAHIKSTQLATCFIAWVSSLTGVLADDLIAIDGKTMRSSYDEYMGKKAIHVLSAWSSKTRLVLVQTQVDSKTNEIKAIPGLLDLLELKGALVTIDAMGCQKAIASQIVEQQADYLLSVKGNQPNLLRDIEDTFKYNKSIDTAKTEEKGHGRLEIRVSSVIENLTEIGQSEQWPELKSIVKIERERTILLSNKTTTETMYYISSRKLTAEQALDSVRSHWGVENQLHHVLDVQFQEDLSRVRNGEADINMATIRKIALNLIRLDPSKGSINVKRQKAAWSDSFRESLLKI
jgi:predicted transposase YbfD/YdcC